MAFSNFVAFPALKKQVARVFVRSLITDLEADYIQSNSKIPTTGGWMQLYTGDGGVQLTPQKTTTALGDQQRGETVLIQDDMKFQLQITVAQTSLSMLQDIILLDPSATGVQTHLDFKANRGTDITSKAVTFFIYNKEDDASNETNTPGIVKSSDAIILYKCSPGDAPAIVKNNVAGTATITFNCLVSTSTGSSGGIAGKMGAFTAA